MNRFAASVSLFLLGTASLFAKCNARSNPPTTMPIGYNAPAQMEMQGVGMYASAGFIYWQAMQDDMEVIDIRSAASPVTSVYDAVDFDFKFQPGFTICLGGNLAYDNWDLFSEYTWFHTGRMETSVRRDGTVLHGGTVPFSSDGSVLASRISGNILDTNNLLSVANFASRSWNLKMDLLDLMLARSYTLGSKLNARPSFGARAAWIRQYMTEFQSSNQPFFRSTVTQNPTFYSRNDIISWGLGVKGACEGDWLLGAGCRMFGYGAFDLLYTHYSLSNTTHITSTGTYANQSFERLYVLRPHVELELGFGYGTHFSDDKCYVDFSAAYGFQVFWNQNMFLENSISTLPADELDINGLKLTLLFAY